MQIDHTTRFLDVTLPPERLNKVGGDHGLCVLIDDPGASKSVEALETPIPRWLAIRSDNHARGLAMVNGRR